MAVALRIKRGLWQSGNESQLVKSAGADFRTPAEIEADRCKQQARAEAEQKQHLQESYKSGYEEGYQKGVAEGKASVALEQQIARDLFEQIEQSFDEVWKTVRQQVASLALDIARRVIGNVVDEKRDLARDLALKLLVQTRDQAKISIAVHPDDADALRAAEIDLYKVAEGVRLIEIVERSALPRGSVVVETDFGGLHLKPSEQVEVVGKSLG